MAEDVIERHRRKLEAHKHQLLQAASGGAHTPRQAGQVKASNYRAEPVDDEILTSRHDVDMLDERGTGKSSPGLSAVSDYIVLQPSAVFDRTTRWASQRDRALQRSRYERGSRELDECTFHPSVSGQSPTLSATPPLKVSPSIHQHIQRHECARQGKEELRRRADSSNVSRGWTRRVTVPQEFSFAHSPERIAALRKPVFPSTATVARENPREFLPEPAPVANQLPANSQLLEAKKKISSQEMEISRLHGCMASLRRELDVAKSKVRQFALSSEM